MNDKIAANMIRTRTSLSCQLRKAAEAQGKSIVTTQDTERPHDPRLMWSVDGGSPLTPGEAAQALGVIWP